jgi:aminomethyltransferase
MRAHQKVYRDDRVAGEITTGSYSPTLGHSIALARVATGDSGVLSVEIRDRRHPVERVSTPFVRNGRRVYKVMSAAGTTGSVE